MMLSDTNHLEYLKLFSEQQIKYITSLSGKNKKLIACAGSGKTRSVIGRIKFLTDNSFFKPKEIYVVTFSKNAADDFKTKVKTLFPDTYTDFCVLKNFSTIDSLAKSVLNDVRPHKSNNKEILSVALRNYLRESFYCGM